MSNPKKSTEAEDVLEFLNSLPEGDSKKKSATKERTSTKDNDIMVFLDELEATDKNGKSASDKKNTGKKKVERQSVPNAKSEDQEVVIVPENETAEKSEETEQSTEKSEEVGGTIPLDPITSFSNWWSSNGSSTVNSIWSNATQQANQLRQKATEEAQRLAKENNISFEEAQKTLKKLALGDDNDDDGNDNNDNGEKAEGDVNEFGDPLTRFTKNLTSVFTSIFSTEEILQIYLIHDMENFDHIEDMIIKSFKTCLKQVQGGIKIEIERSWISKNHNQRNLNLFNGKLIDGEKLILANIENLIKENNSIEKNNNNNDDNVRKSQLYLSILPTHPLKASTSDTAVIDNNSSNSFSFTILLKDITHDIHVLARSQSFPIKWAHWLDGSEIEDGTTEKEDAGNDEKKSDNDKEAVDTTEVDEDIDPSEWVKGWIDDGLELSLGVLSQTYVVKRMGYD